MQILSNLIFALNVRKSPKFSRHLGNRGRRGRYSGGLPGECSTLAPPPSIYLVLKLLPSRLASWIRPRTKYVKRRRAVYWKVWKNGFGYYLQLKTENKLCLCAMTSSPWTVILGWQHMTCKPSKLL